MTPLMAPSIPDLLEADSSSSEFCNRMAFKITPTYSSKLQARLKWRSVVTEAQQQGWDLNFSHADLDSRKVQDLADLIDRKFLNGSFKKACKPVYVVKDKLTGDVPGMSEVAVLNAVAGYEPDTNSMIFFRKGWQRRPSLKNPVQSDGVYCLSKLEWLCHAIGHEMVHCIVHNVCPESREYDAYKKDNGHGPIFMRLNRHIFGHSSTQYKTGWSRLMNMQVQWDSSSSITLGTSSSDSEQG